MYGQDVRARKEVKIVRAIYYDTQHMDMLLQYDLSQATDHLQSHLHLFKFNK